MNAEQAWQTALSAVVSAETSLSPAVAALSAAQAALGPLVLSNGTLYQTDADATNAQIAFNVQGADSKYLADDVAADQVLLGAVAEAWRTSRVTIAAAGTSVQAAGGDLVVAAAGGESVTEGASPSTYVILPGAQLQIAGFHAGANGSRIDFLNPSATAVIAETGSGTLWANGQGIGAWKCAA